ncbi:HIT family protein [Brevibacterium linens]|uniref:Diadenosine tetraphosphate (Ap4A) hydrolase n=2 Tax=Brevibacterium linens TaxID=1703 RepID=A0A2H1HS21_BRELN|nr:HIT family protein [Brevibacterium linens]KAB1944562.1 HIT family protein [Brevibacterium linens ATCC 9172]SMX65735.1 Diadenosine tetraphosphate (Ap4A) hydrolase [Brevibacterium linens]SMX72589.1 Diadenosine tetraphosphate (Ap4A) hydrolase [Brevibacterium linens ATCC 9172]
MATLFTKIINGEVPGTFVYQDDKCVAFLDVAPMTEGHVMIVPREEISHWIDADADLLAHLTAVAKSIGEAQKRAFDCDRIGLLIVGYEVPHLHIHVLPTTSMDDFDISDRAPMQTPEQLEAPAEKIRQALSELS